MGLQYFHLHLISDATGETLIAASRAAAAQYEGVTSIEHVYPLVRSRAQLDKAIAEVEAAPGIVLFTLVDQELAKRLESACKEFSVPCLSVLQRVHKTRKPILITRFGKPIAEVVPPSPPPRPANWMGSMAGTGEILGDIVGPISTEEEWAPLPK